MFRFIWTLIAGFVLGIYSVYLFVIHFKPARKIFIDGTAKALADWIYGPEPVSRPNYGSYYRGPKPASYLQNIQAPRGSLRFTMYVDTLNEANAVIQTMSEIVKEQGQFTLSDIKAAVGKQSTFLDTRYGWLTADILSVEEDGDRFLISSSTVPVRV